MSLPGADYIRIKLFKKTAFCLGIVTLSKTTMFFLYAALEKNWNKLFTNPILTIQCQKNILFAENTVSTNIVLPEDFRLFVFLVNVQEKLPKMLSISNLIWIWKHLFFYSYAVFYCVKLTMTVTVLMSALNNTTPFWSMERRITININTFPKKFGCTVWMYTFCFACSSVATLWEVLEDQVFLCLLAANRANELSGSSFCIPLKALASLGKLNYCCKISAFMMSLKSE